MDAIDADQSQAARAAAVESFRSGRTWVLITTDLLVQPGAPHLTELRATTLQ